MAVALAASSSVPVTSAPVRTRLLAALLGALVFLAPSQGARTQPASVSAPDRSLALVGVHVVDITTGAILRDRTVIMKGGEIVSVTPLSSLSLTGSVRVVSMRGKFVIPGFRNMRITGAMGAASIAAGVTDGRPTGSAVLPGLPTSSHADVLHAAPSAHDAWEREVRAMAASEAGMLVGVGTAGGLADELEALVKEADLTPLQALQAATCNAARATGSPTRNGRVEAGYRADLVVLDRDPLLRIGNVRRVHAVVRGGQLLDRFALDSLRARP